MNETNEVGWLARLIIGVGTIGVLMVLVGCMFAPAFAPWIRRKLALEYIMEKDWEERVNADMKSITVFLWIVAVLAWTFLVWCNY